MSPLQTELERLYGKAVGHEATARDAVATAAASTTTVLAPSSGLPDSQALADGMTRTGLRCMVLELGQPADWQTLACVWQGVQADLGLPAPAIAVNGKNAYQLWFSLAQAVHPQRATAFLIGLQNRYLPGVQAERVRLYPQPAKPEATVAMRMAPLPPALQPSTQQWSAFVAPDLAALFSDEPWLDREPSAEAQATVLARLQSIAPGAFDAAIAQVASMPDAAVGGGPASPLEGSAGATALAGKNTPAVAALGEQYFGGTVGPALDTPCDEPCASQAIARRFLLQVMQDPSVDMPLRIEAARALLWDGKGKT